MKRQDYQVGFYNLAPSVRDRHSRLLKAKKIGYLLQQLDYSLASSICLDVGCSSGIITETLSELFGKMIGLEYDQIALANVSLSARQPAHYIQGDAMSLPLPDEAIDMVICAQVYEHVPDDEILIAEIYRVLKPGGFVFFSGPNKLCPIEPHYLLPFLHWLPQRLADSYLRLLNRGEHYYERSRTLWGLKRLVTRFEVSDVTAEIIQSPDAIDLLGSRILALVPKIIWKLLLPVLPNFNWILRKPLD